MSPRAESAVYAWLVLAVGVVAALGVAAFYLAYNVLWSVVGSSWRGGVFFLAAGFAGFWGSIVVVRFLAATRVTGSGTHAVLDFLHLRSGFVEGRDCLAKPVASAITLGFGGSVGPEGPALLIGSGLGSLLGRAGRMTADRVRRLFVAGMAAGMTAVFRTPVTGLLFALEIPYKRDLEKEPFLEAAVASTISYLVAVSLLGAERLFHGEVHVSLTPYTMVHVILFGVIAGLYSAVFVRLNDLASRLAGRARRRGWFWALAAGGSLAMGLAGWFLPEVAGVGVDTVERLLAGGLGVAWLLLALVVAKMLATIVTINFGGSGGMFFPALVDGALLGALYSKLLGLEPMSLYVALGMVALLSGTHKILLAPIAFVAETLGPSSIIPGLIASVASYFVSGRASFFKLQPLSKLKGEELALERLYSEVLAHSPEILRRIRVGRVMSRRPYRLHAGITVERALEEFERVPYRVLPVVDAENRLVGYVRLEDLTSVPESRHQQPLSTVMMRTPLIFRENAALIEVIEEMLEKDEDHAFIVDEKGRLIGVVADIDLIRHLLHATHRELAAPRERR